MRMRDRYKELKKALEIIPIFKKDKENLKQGDIILITKNKENESTKYMIGTIKKITEKKIYMEECRTYSINIGTGITPNYKTKTENVKSYYKIKNTKSINKIERKHSQLREALSDIFLTIQKEIEKTPHYRFITKDQTLPIELEQIQPEERLEITKRLEKVLEKEVDKINYKDAEQLCQTRELFEYAQECGIVSEKAKELYKKKWQKLKKTIRKLELY